MFELPITVWYSIIVSATSFIVSFILINFYSKLEEKRKIKTKLKNNESYILFWINVLNKRLEKFINNLTLFSDSLKIWDNEKTQLNYTRTHLPLEKLDAVSFVDIYAAFTFNKEGDTTINEKHYLLLINTSEYLNNIYIEINNRLEEFRNANNDYRKKISNSINEINDQRIKFYQDSNHRILADEFLEGFLKHHENNKESCRINMNDCLKKYILPLDDICAKAFQENHVDNRVTIIQKQIQLFKSNHKNNEDLKSRLYNYISTITLQLDLSRDNLSSFQEYYVHSKFKKLFKLK